MFTIKPIAMKISTNVLLFGLALASCSKESAPTAYSYLSIANVSPTLGTYNVYLDGTKANTSGALAFGGTMAYMTMEAGDRVVKFTTESGTDILLNKTLNLEVDGIYSAFLIDKEPKLELLLVKDNITNANTDKAYIRFIHLSPDAPALDLVLNESSTLVSGQSYKTASSFQPIEPKAYTFNLKYTSSGNIAVQSQELTLEAGKYYTIISKGLLNAGDIDQPFGIQFITNL